MAKYEIDEPLEVGDVLEDSKQPGNFIKIIAVRENGYTFRFWSPELNEFTGPEIKTELLNDLRTFTYFKKVS